MKAKALISLLAAGTITLSAGMSFALWDTLTDSKQVSNIELAEAVTVSLDSEELNFTGKLAPEGSTNGGALTAPLTVSLTNDSKIDSVTLTVEDIGTYTGTFAEDTTVTPDADNKIQVAFVNSDTKAVYTNGKVPKGELNKLQVKVTLDANATASDFTAGDKVAFKINATANAATPGV